VECIGVEGDVLDSPTINFVGTAEVTLEYKFATPRDKNGVNVCA
jgi:hypothetical protein